jgi:hypothetical protein
MKSKVIRKTKIDMSPQAVTARLKRACGLGDAEMLMTAIRSESVLIRDERTIPELPWLQAQEATKNSK